MEEEQRINMNPLMIPGVLTTLFKQSRLDFGDLKNVRLVCKDWYFESLPRWRKTAVITVSALECKIWGLPQDLEDRNEEDVDDEEESEKNSEDDWSSDDDDKGPEDVKNDKVKSIKSYPTMSTYLRFLFADVSLPKDPLLLENKLSTYPYVRMKLINWNMLDYVKDDLWAQIGRELEYLHLENCKVTDDLNGWICWQRHGIINKTVNVLPKLTTLMISAPNGNDQRYNLRLTVWGEQSPHAARMIPKRNVKVFVTSGCKVNWSRVFACFPDLDTQEWNLLEELVGQPQEVQKKLKYIDLIYSRHSLITRPVLLLMGYLRLENLTYLSVSLDKTVKENEAQFGFRQLFQISGNLKVWKVLREGSAGPPFREFPDGIEMKSLKELHLYGNVTRSLQFIRFTPNLEKLVIYYTCAGGQRVDGRQLRSGQKFSGDLVRNTRIGSGERYIPPLEKLKTLWVDAELIGRSWAFVGMWMPRVRELRTVLDEFSFSRVVSMWEEGLEELVWLSGSRIYEYTLTADGRYSRSLKDLHELRRLGIDEIKNPRFSDGLVRNGFLKMGRLEVVQLPKGIESQLSSEAIELLKQKNICLKINSS